MPQLKIFQDTVLKQQPILSTKLADDQKQSVKAGSIFQIQSYASEADHLKVTLTDQSFQGKNTWYLFQRYGCVLEDGEIIFPSSAKLAVPYYDQLDNSEDPYGTCNVTATAMTMAYLGVTRKHPEMRFPDELNEYCNANGLDRHDPYVLAQVIKAYGLKDDFKTTASFEEIKEWLVQGNPAIVHGYFTQSGHIIVLIGFDQDGFWVNDPYGEWNADGYDTYSTREDLHYSYDLVYRTSYVNDQLWVHFVSRG